MDVTLFHGIDYDVENPVAVEDLIKSLEAHAKLLRRAGDFLTELYPGLVIDPKQVSVVRLSQESPLSELFAYSMVMVFQKDLEKEVPHLIQQITGTEVPHDYDTLVTVIVMIIAIHGIAKAYEALFPGRDKSGVIETQQSLVMRLASLTGVTADRIMAALEVLFRGRQHRGTVLAAQKLFAPTRGQRASIREARSGAILIDPAVVAEAQAAAGIPYEGSPEDEKAKTSSEFFRGVRIILHAMDKDRKQSGWAGHVPSLFDDRIPMHLEKTQNPQSIFGRGEIKGDILLTREENDEGDMYPKEFLLVQTYLD